MVIELSTAFTMRCPTCGRLDIKQLNIFQLSGKQKQEIICDCGRSIATVSRKGEKYIQIDYDCIICDHRHSVVLPKKVFWTKNHLNSLLCLDSDLNLGFFGSYKLIRAELNRQQAELDSMANELGFEDFVNPEIMLEILDYLHDLAIAGGLFCECGSHDINIDLFSDKLELSCNKCNSTILLPAVTKRDIDNLKYAGEVVIKLTTSKSKNSKTQR